jgi:hypothetical protein
MDTRQMRENLGQPHNRHVSGIHQEFASGSLHFLAAHAEKVCRGKKLFQRTDKLSAIGVAGGLPGGEQERSWGILARVDAVFSCFRAKILNFKF